MEMLKHGMTAPFESFLHAIIEQKVFRWKEWTFPFCYGDLLNRLKTIDDMLIVVRTYNAHKSVVDDFAPIIGLAANQVEMLSDARANAQLPLIDCLSLYFKNWLGRPLKSIETETIKSMLSPLHENRIGLSKRSKQTVVETFRQSNQLVMSQFDLPEFESMKCRLRGSSGDTIDEICMESIFSDKVPLLIH